MAQTNLDRYFQMGTHRVMCNLCGADDGELLPFEDRFRTRARAVVCRCCGLMYLNPRWTDDTYARFYEADYRQLMGEQDGTPREAMIQQRIHGAAILDFCHHFVPRGARVLDVGCSAGGILAAFREGKECACVGVEPSEQHSAFVKSQLGFEVHTGVFEQVGLSPGTFDLVMNSQTLNHLLDPRDFLARARQALSDAGKLFLEVQNFPEYVKLSGRPIQIDHTYYFAPETLECLLRRVGFTPVRVEVDTAISARSVARYMWHRSASIHIRVLAEKSAPLLDFPLPDACGLKRQVLGNRKRGLKSLLRGRWRRAA